MDQHEIREKFKDYRESGIALSVTLISLSSALILWGNNLLNVKDIASCVKIIVFTQIVFCSLTILSCLCIQFFNYQGYKHEARSVSDQSTQRKANCWFSKEDYSVYTSIVLFLISLLFCILFFINKI